MGTPLPTVPTRTDEPEPAEPQGRPPKAFTPRRSAGVPLIWVKLPPEPIEFQRPPSLEPTTQTDSPSALAAPRTVPPSKFVVHVLVSKFPPWGTRPMTRGTEDELEAATLA